ncbi:Uncharacterised protein [Mycobacterium tuberculosis]|nr:Uncharacterised protein [Mycobacterium tuberculosis]
MTTMSSCLSVADLSSVSIAAVDEVTSSYSPSRPYSGIIFWVWAVSPAPGSMP